MALNVVTCSRWRASLKTSCRYIGGQYRCIHNNGTTANIATGITHSARAMARAIAMKMYDEHSKITGPLVDEIRLSSIKKPTDRLGITDVQTVASFNSIPSILGRQVIAVPGCPRKFNRLVLPHQLPKYDPAPKTFEPVLPKTPDFALAISPNFDAPIKSLLTMRPDFSFKSIGLITSQTEFKKLLHFVVGNSKYWRLYVDVIEDTMFVQGPLFMPYGGWQMARRLPPRDTETRDRNSYYKPSLEEAVLRPDPTLGGEHVRINHYNFGGTECLIGTFPDGYVDDDFDSDKSAISQEASDNPATSSDSGLDIDDSTLPAGEVLVIKRGRIVNDNNIIKLELNHSTGRHNMRYPWIMQLPHRALRYRHKDGQIIAEPRERNLKKANKNFEMEFQEDVQNLWGLIAEIKAVAKKTTRGSCIVECVKEDLPLEEGVLGQVDVLKVYEREGALQLPQGVREKLWGN